MHKKIDYSKGFKTIAKYLKPHHREIFILLALGVVSSISNALLPYFIGRIFDVVRSNQIFNVFGYYLPVAFILVGTWFLLRILGDLVDWRVNLRNERLAAVLEGEYIVNGFETLFYLPLSFHRSKKVGEIANRLSRAADWLVRLVNYTALNLAPQFFSIAIGLAVIFLVKPLFGFLFIFVIAVCLFLFVYATPRLVAIQQKMHKAYNRAYGNAYDDIANIQPMKQATAEDCERKKLYKVFLLKAVKFYENYIVFWQSLATGQNFIISFAYLGIFVFSLHLASLGQLTIGQMIMFISYGSMVFNPIRSLSENFQAVQNGLVAIERAEKILILKPEPYALKGKTIKDIKGKVEFRDVDFSYEKKKLQVLKGLNFVIYPGETIALVGKSGAGKTTIADLLGRFFELKKGKILVDGYDIKDLDLKFLRSIIAYVPQEVVLFNDSIKNNIKYGKFDASDKDVEEAVRLAYADKFIDLLPKKYEQIVGERGIKLSVGQKQRIAIARAVLRNPKILVLDEPTSALDAESERYVTEALEKLMQGRTTFIIAHRLSTVRKADRIIVLHKGGVAEIGSHDELIKKLHGIYRKLYELQFGLEP